MVLSNKKLKQKIRAELAESFTASESQTQNQKHKSEQNHPNSQTNLSLKSLLNSVTLKPRLSKREIRRFKVPPSQEQQKVGLEKTEDSVAKKGKKRKRDEGIEKEEKGVEDLSKKKSNNTKKKKKKKKKGKKQKKGTKEKGVEKDSLRGGESEEQAMAETPTETPISKEELGIPTKVYVGGIPYYSTVDDIRSFFESCGTVTEVDCLKFPETGKFNGIAFISFKTEAAAKRALALDGSDMGGLSLKIQPYKATRDKKVSDYTPAIVVGYNKIYIGNLSWDVTEDELKKFFSGCKISFLRLGTDKETGEFRGYAHVNFADTLSLNMALKLDGKVVRGRPVRIRCAVRKDAANTDSKAAPSSEKGNGFVKAGPKKADEFTSVPVPTIHNKFDYEKTEDAKKRCRTCYECGKKGHLSASCPNKQGAEINSSGQAADFASGPNPTNSSKLDDARKIRGRTCYECGKKGHLSSSCPNKPGADSINPSKQAAEELTSEPISTNSNNINDGNMEPVSGKIKRRTCYECGEKGHLSSSCPNKKFTDLTNSSKQASKQADDFSYNKDDGLASAPVDKNGADENPGVPISGKIKRRTCYECGEKGHLSSSCPKKQMLMQ